MKCLRAAGLACVTLVVLLVAGPGVQAEPPPGFGPEIIHLPLLERQAEQGILRPVPVSAELPGELALRAHRVLLVYRLWGEPDWTSLLLRRNGRRYEGAVPCLEISTVTGNLRYYIRVHDAEGRVIASAGSRAKPYVVTIKHDTTLAPDARRVTKCPDPADCPRGLPGCPSEKVEVSCLTDRDCEGGARCSWRGFCETVDRPRNSIVVSAAQDLGFLATTGACHITSQENEGNACYRDDGAQYIGSPVLTNEPLGFGPGPTRVVVGFEHLVHYDTTLGVRAGWALRGAGPTPRGGVEFIPLSVAVRATHWFGADPFARSGWRPFAFVTAGYATVDVETKVRVREDPAAPSRQGGNALEQNLTLWKRAGDAFVGAGGGVAFAFQVRQAAFLELTVFHAFPFGALIIAPTLGAQFAF